MAKTKSLPAGALVIVVGKDGTTPYWEAKWRHAGRQIKRRLGPAHVKRRNAPLEGADGWQKLWSKERGRAPDDVLDADAAVRAKADAIRQYAVDYAEGAHAALAGLPEAPITFGQLADDWLIERRSEVTDGDLKAATVKDYASMLRRPDAPVKPRGRESTAHVMRVFEHVAIEDITGRDIDKFLAKLQTAKLSPRTRTKYRVVLSMIFDYAVRREAIQRTPMTPQRRKRARQRVPHIEVYSLDVVERVANEADDQIGEVIRLAAITGLRQGELLALRWRDIDWSAQSITVRSRYVPGEDTEDVPKGGRARTVPMSDQAAVVLDRLSKRENWTKTGDLVFGIEVGNVRKGRAYEWTYLDPSTVRRGYAAARDSVIDKTRKATSEVLPVLTFHKLRHTFGSRCATAGVPLATIKSWMGHEDIATTMVYVHFQPHADDAARLTRAFASGTAEEAAQITA